MKRDTKITGITGLPGRSKKEIEILFKTNELNEDWLNAYHTRHIKYMAACIVYYLTTHIGSITQEEACIKAGISSKYYRKLLKEDSETIKDVADHILELRIEIFLQNL